MNFEIEPNPNCAESQQFVFNELGKPEPVYAILVGDEGKETGCDIAGVDEAGKFVQAMAVKIADSSDGVAYMIYGGTWGIRLRPAQYAGEPWDLANRHQWGEPFKIYGRKEDIFYGNGPR